MRVLLGARIAVLFAGGLLFAQEGPAGPDAAEGAPAEPPPAGEVVIPDAGPPIEDASVARLETRNFQKAMKDARGDAEQRAALLRGLGRWNHTLVLQEARRYVRDRETAVAVAAVVAVARQTECRDAAGRVLHAVTKRDERLEVACAALVGMGRIGFDLRAVHEDVVATFERGFGEIRKAAARYFGYVKSKPAFQRIAERLDEPHMTVPPVDWRGSSEEWYEAAWYEWKANRPWYRWALGEIVPGETFETTAEARQWAGSDAARELGIVWE